MNSLESISSPSAQVANEPGVALRREAFGTWIVDGPSLQELRRAFPKLSALHVVVTDYEAAVELAFAEERSAGAAPAATLSTMVRRLVELEERLWADLAVVCIEEDTRALADVRRRWRRNVFFDAASPATSLLSAGIDPCRFMERDWASRLLLDRERAQFIGKDASATPAPTRLVGVLDESEVAIDREVDELRSALLRSSEAREAMPQSDDRPTSNRAAFLAEVEDLPGAVARSIERAADVIQEAMGRTAAAAWRDRFLRQEAPLLFGHPSPEVRTLLSALDESAWQSVEAPAALIDLADERWKAHLAMREAMLRSYKRHGGLPQSVEDPQFLAAARTIAARLDARVEAAGRTVGERISISHWESWSVWFARATDEPSSREAGSAPSRP